jgi:hypothetical protein
MPRDAAFERARRVAVKTMSTDEWKDDLRKEDPTKARHLRQVTRLTGLGMIIESWQSGRAYTYASRSGGVKKGVDRSYVLGFVSADIADGLIDAMTRTDKYVAKMHLDASMYVSGAFTDVGKIAVTVMGGNAEAWVRVVGHPELRKCNYGRWIYVEPANDTEQKREARAVIGPYMEHPVPDTAVCLVCVDLKWGRRADGPNGLFTQLEQALSARE